MDNEFGQRLDDALQAAWAVRQRLLRKLLREVAPVEAGPPGALRQRSRGLTPEQYAIISILDAFGHGVMVSEIAAGINLPHANVTRTLDRLEDKGLVRRAPGKTDRRQVMVKLTLEGTKAARRLREVSRRLDELFWGRLDDGELRMLLSLVERLLKS